MADEGKHSNKAIVWLFGGRRRALLLFALSILIILNFANQENWAVQAKGLSGIISWLASIIGNDLTLLIIRVFALAIFFILILLIFSAYSKIAVKHKSYESSSIYHFLMLLFLIALTVGLFWQKGFHSTAPLFWIIAIFVLWVFLMILSYPVLLPIESDIYDLARLRGLFLAKGPISLLGRFRKTQEYLLVGHARNFLIATALILFSASYNKDYAVTGVTPLKNLTNWTLNGTTWLKDSTIGLLINKSKIQNDLQASSSPEIIKDKVLNYINTSGGEISSITIQDVTFQVQKIANATSKSPINLSHNDIHRNIIINQSTFMDNSISDATLKDVVLNNLSYADEIVKKSLLHSPVDLILGNISTANATINNIILKNITVLNATINSSETSGNLTASIDIIKNVTLKNATILDASFYKTALDNISFLNSSIAGTLPIIPGSSEIIVGSTSTVSHLLVSFAAMVDIILSNFWSNLSSIFLLWAAIEILAIAWAARKRMVIEDFDDETTEKKEGKLASRLLAMKISDLNAIYSKANETRSVSTSTGIDLPLQASIKIGDVSDLLKDIKTTSTFSVGGIEIPTNLLASVLEGIVRGPKLTGFIHKEKNKDNKDILLLSAYVFGGGIPYRSWQVRRELDSGSNSQDNSAPAKMNSPKETPPQLLASQSQSTLETGMLIFDEAMNELACRIFTDLVFNPSQRELVRWKATMKMAEGLRAYRDCLRSRMNKKLKLREAERRLIEALAEDEKFNMLHYNLGVVYKELEMLDAADKAFSKSVEKNPEMWEGYYALGMTLFEKMQQDNWNSTSEEQNLYAEIISKCHQALELMPETDDQKAKVYDLIGLTQNSSGEEADSKENLTKAVILSYLGLYNAELKGKDTKDIKIIIMKCLKDLANVYRVKNDFGGCKLILKEALSVSPSDELARSMLESKRTTERRKNGELDSVELRKESMDDLIKDEENDQAYLNICNTIKKSLEVVIRLHYENTHKLNTKFEEDAVKTLRASMNEIDNEKQEYKEKFKDIINILYEYENDIRTGRIFDNSWNYYKRKINYLEGRINKTKSEYSDICCIIGDKYSEENAYVNAERYYRKAKDALNGNLEKKASLDLWKKHATSLKDQNIEVQKDMEEAISFDPLNHEYRYTLGLSFLNQERFEEAIIACENALLLNPDDAYYRYLLGVINFWQSDHLGKFELRNEAFRKVSKYLEDSLALEMEDTFQRTLIYYWLGQTNTKLKKYDLAINNLRVASYRMHANNYIKQGLITDGFLGLVYMKYKRYEKGEETLQSVTENAEKLLNEGTYKIYDNCADGLSNENRSLGYILIKSHLDLAFAYADQPTLLGKASITANKSKKYLEDLEKAKKEEINNNAQVDSEIKECKSEYNALLGVIAYKRSLLEIESKDKLNEAIKHLKESLNQKPSTRGYFYLANSYMLMREMNSEIIRLQDSPKHENASQCPDLEKFKIFLEELQNNLKEKQNMTQSEIKDYLDKISTLQSIQNLIEKNKTLDDKINRSMIEIKDNKDKICLEKENRLLLNKIDECCNHLAFTDLNEEYSVEIEKIKKYLDDQEEKTAPSKAE